MKEKRAGTTGAILEIAHRCLDRGEIYLATDTYQRIMQKYPRTPEGQEARDKIMEIAQHHEANGRKHVALSLYEKVAAFPYVQELALGKEILRGGVAKTAGENILSAGENRKGESHGRNQETVEEIPFVDLTETVNIRQNFERLGQVQKRVADISGAVTSLRKLIPDGS